ncbi:serine hydrolase domain-containing protein [Actinokineospora auranticolor]|uniref:serine hydrolase domain-containing protein n=1 Tax=Actinokineospora auranticolor TaxID=155976 RepID=UPI002481D609|nr:serine hydrolase domain-containing protein [Actinokineospora auranticolor]
MGILAGTAGTSSAAAGGGHEVARALENAIRGDGVPGGQVVITQDDRSGRISAGVGDLRTGRPFPDRASVRIGSNTKAFAATVVLQLVAEQRVDLDAPVERYLPGVVRGNGNDGARVTVRQLLQHTSGLPDYLRLRDPLTNRWNHTTPVELVRSAMSLPPDFPPGAGWRYSNTNYALAGMIIERVTHRSAGDEINRRIIEPLRLAGTYYPAEYEVGIRGAHPRGYHTVDGKRVDYTHLDPSWAGAAGAMVSTGEDLNRFYTALLRGRLLPEAQLAEMKRTVPADVYPGAGYGLGLVRIPTSCGKEFWGHGGSIPGFRTRGGVTADGRAVTVTTNEVADSDTRVMAVVDTAVCGNH